MRILDCFPEKEKKGTRGHEKSGQAIKFAIFGHQLWLQRVEKVELKLYEFAWLNHD